MSKEEALKKLKERPTFDTTLLAVGDIKSTSPIQLTKEALNKIKEIMVEDNIDKEKNYLQVSMFGGCSGFKYGLNFTDKVNEELDYIFEQDDIKVFFDKRMLQFISGTTIDYINASSSSGFHFDNPNSTDCGSCSGCH